MHAHMLTLALAVLPVLSPALARPVRSKDVHCRPIKTGILIGTDASGAALNAAFEGSLDQEGNEILDFGFYGSTAPAQQFTFQACRSHYTGYKTQHVKGTKTFYGHLVVADEASSCVAALPFPYKKFYTGPAKSNCSAVDDESQLAQTWSLTVTKDATGKRENVLSFVGTRKGDPPRGAVYGFNAYYVAEYGHNAYAPEAFYDKPSAIVNGTYQGAPVYTFSLA